MQTGSIRRERQKEKIDASDAAGREPPGGESWSRRRGGTKEKSSQSGYPLVETDVMKQKRRKKFCKSRATDVTKALNILL